MLIKKFKFIFLNIFWNDIKKDVERCCLLMEDLVKLPFTQSHLFKAPEIVETIRKVLFLYNINNFKL